MSTRVVRLRAVPCFFLLILVMFLSSVAAAQDADTPKYDVFLGYQWLHPGVTVASPTGTASNPLPMRMKDMPEGAGASVAYNFTKIWAAEFDLGRNGTSGNTLATISAGPRVMLRQEYSSFFVHSLLSYSRLGVNGQGGSNGIGGVIGGGFDLKATKWLSWRVFEADWLPSAHHYPDLLPATVAHPNMSSARLRTGIVLNLDYPETKPVGATVSVQPAQSMVGEPLTATATPSDFNPKHQLTYDWASTCGKITGNGTTASIDTNGTSGGDCTATVKVTDPKAKRNNIASASSSFMVKEPPKNPPTMSCTASPTSVQAGATVNVNCTCSSPDNVPVTVSNFTASSGTISGNGNSATLNTTGASPGTITVNASCSDQRGLNTPATTEVAVENPPPPPPAPDRALEARLALHSIYFPTALPTKANPKGGLVKSQQATLTTLAADFKKYLETKPDAKLTLEGHADPRGSAEFNQALSERRVERTKSFLIEQGIPEGAIETKAFGAQQQLTSDEVKSSVDSDSDLTPGERQRIVKNMRTIILASNRRVDVTLSTTGQESVRKFPFSAEDSLTLIGGREKPAAAKPATKKRPAPKKKQ
jgi:outer membrane protein OmpA-like peptidoglycan-associated protein